MGASQHGRVHRGHDFASRSPNHGEAKDAIVILTDQSFHETLGLIGRLRPEHRVHWQPCDPCEHTSAFRFALAQSYMGKQRISEHAIRNQSFARAAVAPRQIVTNDPKIVLGYVRELWAAGAFPEGPNVPRTRLQLIVHANVTATVQLNAGIRKPHSCGIGDAPNRDQYVAAVDILLTRGVRTATLTSSPDRPRTWSNSARART